jgi:hypothetical protein
MQDEPSMKNSTIEWLEKIYRKEAQNEGFEPDQNQKAKSD